MSDDGLLHVSLVKCCLYALPVLPYMVTVYLHDHWPINCLHALEASKELCFVCPIAMVSHYLCLCGLSVCMCYIYSLCDVT